jgi:hypothetical protein
MSKFNIGPDLEWRWFCWCLVLGDPLVPEPQRQAILREAAAAAVAPATAEAWRAMAVEFLLELAGSVGAFDLWRCGDPAVWSWRLRYVVAGVIDIDEEADNLDLLPAPTGEAAGVVSAALAGDRHRLANLVTISDWDTVDMTCRSLGAAARFEDPHHDLGELFARAGWVASERVFGTD